MQNDSPIGPSSEPLTLLFTRLEDAAALWRRLEQRFAPLLAVHDRVLRAALARFDAYEVKREGTAFVFAFRDAAVALRAALAGLEAMAATPWQALAPELAVAGGAPVMRVSMGLHTGPVFPRVDPLSGRMDYFGPTVNVAARLAQAARGSVALLSRDTLLSAAESGYPVEDPEPEGAWLLLHGAHRLRGMTMPVHVVELRARHQASSVGEPMRSTRSLTEEILPNNLMERGGPLFGREELLHDLEQAIGRGSQVIVLQGPAGVGKSRLAAELARWALTGIAGATFRGGVWWVSLSGARTPLAVCAELGRALGVALFERDPAVQLGRALSARGPLLVVLDGAEATGDALGGLLERWIVLAPEATFVVTGRMVAGVTSEARLLVRPLALPAEGASAEDLAQNAAVRLLLDALHPRGEEEPGLPLLQAAAALVRRLEGLPLAMVLAASNVAGAPVEQVVEQLHAWSEHQALALGPSDEIAMGMRHALDQTASLLPLWGLGALAQLSVFRAGFSPEAAEAVIELSHWPDAPDSLDVLRLLVDHSLLLRDEGEHQARLSMLGSVAAYGLECFAQPGVGGAEARREAEERHGAWYARLGAPEALARLSRRNVRMAVLDLASDAENLRAAARRAARQPDLARTLRCAAALLALAERRGPASLITELLDALQGLDVPAELQARWYADASAQLWEAGMSAEAHACIARGLAAVRLPTGRPLRALMQGHTARLLGEHKAPRRALEMLQGALAHARAGGDREATTLALEARAALQSLLGLADDAGATLEEAYQVALGSPLLEARVRVAQAETTLARGHAAAAHVALHEVGSLCEDLGHDRLRTRILVGLGEAALALGQLSEARDLLDRAAPDLEQQGELTRIAHAHDLRGRILGLAGRGEEAGAAFAAALHLHDRLGRPVQRAIVMGHQGEALLDLGRLEEARGALAEAQTALRAYGADLRAAELQAASGELLVRRGQAAQGLQQLALAVEELRAGRAQMGALRALIRLGRAHTAAGDPGARRDLAEAESLAASLGLASKGPELARLAWLRSRLDPARNSQPGTTLQ